MTYEEEKKLEKDMKAKFIAALKTIDIVVKAEKGENESSIWAELGAHQSLFCRVNSYGHKGKFHITVSANKVANDKDIYINGKEYTRFEVNISHTKTPEQIGKDIQKRIMDTPEFTANYAYIEKAIESKNKYAQELEANKEFFSQTGLVFSEGGDRNSASKGRISAKVSNELNYCEMTLYGLTKEQWLKVFKVVKPITEAAGEN